MQSTKNRALAAELSFILGIILAITGFTALLYSARTGRIFMLVLSGAMVATAFIFFRLATSLRRNPRYFFVATYSVLLGVFLLLRFFDVLDEPLSALWPLLVIISGLSLLSAGFFARRRPGLSILVPSAAFILLGLLFLLFSFDIVNFSFRYFFLRWWPLLLLLAGLLLLIVSICESKR